MKRATQERRQQLARIQRRIQRGPLHEFYDKPGQTEGSNKYFCEACAVPIPARDKDWQMHVAGFKHQTQVADLHSEFGRSDTLFDTRLGK